MASRDITPLLALLEADSENVQHCRNLLGQLDSRLFADLEFTAKAFEDFAGGIAKTKEAPLKAISGLLTKHGLNAEDFLTIAKSGEKSSRAEEIRAAAETLNAVDIRALVLLLCGRQFRWGATDFLRFRLTPAFGYVRQHAESAALLQLFAKDPSMAMRWLEIQTDEEGRRFFNDTKKPIREILTDLGLLRFYETGSGTALHVRLASMVRGAPLIRKDGDDTILSVPYQEVKRGEEHRFFISVVSFLDAQAIILRRLPSAFPEVSFESWMPQAWEISAEVARLRDVVSRAYPKEIEAIIEQRAAAARQK